MRLEIRKRQFYSFTLFFVTFVTQNDFVSGLHTYNISCYQCVRQANVECEPQDLRPCMSNQDRCVTNIRKDKDNGFNLVRECGLGPCTFSDLLGDKGFGFDKCDRSKDEYFCVFCCQENGCNKSNTSVAYSRPDLTTFVFCFFAFLYLAVGKT